MQDLERDESLFSNKLSEKIKSAKTIEKQGLQVKKTVTIKSFTASQQPPTPGRPCFQGNWTGPPRFSTPVGEQRGAGRAAKAQPTIPPATASTSCDCIQPVEVCELQQTACPNKTINQVHAGRLQLHYSCWTKITNNRTVLNWIKYGFQIPLL